MDTDTEQLIALYLQDLLDEQQSILSIAVLFCIGVSLIPVTVAPSNEDTKHQ